MSSGRRYRLDPLFAAMGMSPHAACVWLGCSGSTELEYRRRGVTDRVADRLAVKAGFHPFEIWPELAEHRHAEIQKVCAECSELFVPVRKDQRFCGKRCRDRFWNRETNRKYRQGTGREKALEWRRRWYQENAMYERARERRRYWSKRDIPSDTRTSPSGKAHRPSGPMSTNDDREVAS